jgi:hypothetical protein
MKYLAALLLVSAVFTSYSQQLPDFTKIPLTRASEYKAAEPSVLRASVYVLSMPFSKDDQSRIHCVKFILKWMTGTPDYSFTFGESKTKYFKNQSDLMGLYIAAMSKYALENPATSKDQNAVGVNAMVAVLTYSNNPTNNINMTQPMKRLWEANEEGKLSEALNEDEK